MDVCKSKKHDMGDAFSVSTRQVDLLNETSRTEVNEWLNGLYASKLLCVSNV